MGTRRHVNQSLPSSDQAGLRCWAVLKVRAITSKPQSKRPRPSFPEPEFLLSELTNSPETPWMPRWGLCYVWGLDRQALPPIMQSRSRRRKAEGPHSAFDWLEPQAVDSGVTLFDCDLWAKQQQQQHHHHLLDCLPCPGCSKHFECKPLPFDHAQHRSKGCREKILLMLTSFLSFVTRHSSRRVVCGCLSHLLDQSRCHVGSSLCLSLAAHSSEAI